jgi:sugar transferase (PEP-CTERM/EpsH1 system associated)
MNAAGLRILFITARFPYPVLKGDQVRAYHQLRALGKRHRISLLSFAGKRVDPRDLAQVERLCEDVTLVPLSRLQMASALLRNAASPLPWQTLVYQTEAMNAAVREHLKRGYDVVHVQLARMAEHVVHSDTPCVIDLIDALSLNMQRRARQERGALRRLVEHEAGRMQSYERRLCDLAARTCVVSPIDRHAIGPFERLHVNQNGVDIDHFAFSSAERRPDSLVFTGNMGYFPNVNAVTWFVRSVLPLIRAEIPTVTLEIVGANPTRDVRALGNDDGAITVTGFVDDVRVHLARASAGIVPMRAGSGMQNKVIEAMASGTPLVATPFALGGIAACDERDVLVAHDAVQFAMQTVRMLRSAELRDRIARSARSLVERSHGWETSVAALEELYHEACDRRVTA